MKKHLFMTGILVCVLVIGAGTAHAQTLITLDDAIQGAVEEFSYELRRGSRVAIVYMRSGSARMSNHLIEEMISVTVSQRIFTVVDRAQLDLIQDEIDFQMSGEVSDSSALAIGQKLGARYIVTGRLEPIGDYYRFRVRVIEVETAVVQVTYSANVQNDRTVASLLGSGGAHTPAVSSSDYVDFTAGQRWATWALNAFTIPGIGSYIIMKDGVGGTWQLVPGIFETVFFAVYLITPVDGLAGIYIISYGIIGLFRSIYNIVRSSTYHKPHLQTAAMFDPEAWNIAVLPGKDGIEKVSLSYTLRF